MQTVICVLAVALVGSCPENTGPDLVTCPCTCALAGEPGFQGAETTARICVNADAADAEDVILDRCRDRCGGKAELCVCLESFFPPVPCTADEDLARACPDREQCATTIDPGNVLASVEVLPNGCTDDEPAGGDRGAAVAAVTDATTREPADEQPDPQPLAVSDTIGLGVPAAGAPTGTLQTTLRGDQLLFADFDVTAPTLTILGVEVAAMGVFLKAPFSATVNGTSYHAAPETAEFLLIAEVAGLQTAFDATNSDDITGTYDEASGTFDFATVITDTGGVADATIDFVLEFTARPPVVAAGDDRIVECGAVVTLLGDASDPDGDLRRTVWGIDTGTADAVTLPGPTASFVFDVGEHTASFQAFDERLSSVAHVVHVTANDTTPPDLADFASTAPLCVFPPNHKYVVLRVGEEFAGVVTDTCDTDPALVITGAESSQPEDALGDGNTANDVVVFPDRVCIRSERTGNAESGRRYSIHLAAVDASGNSSDPTIEVLVAHDEGQGMRCTHIGVDAFVDDDNDPLCDATAAADGALADVAWIERGRPGCAAVGGGSVSVLALAVALLFRRHRLRA